jgi:penicillin-binding protein 1A
MVREAVIEQFGNEVLANGSVAYTTIDSRLQTGANDALRDGLRAYDKRHGYRGPIRHVELAPDAGDKEYARELAAERTIVGLVPALVVKVSKERAELVTAETEPIELALPAVAWARPYLSESSRGPTPKQVTDVLKRGDIVRLARDADGQWSLAQLPKAQSALVSLDTDDGGIRALVGGLSFTLSKFNRAIQSSRQPGSSFKPFIYAAAFEHGFTPASVVNDAPLAFPDPSRPDGVWRPGNDDDKFEGPTRLREALVHSRNTISVRILDAIGVKYARDYITRFGIPLAAMPENLSMALGTSSVAPIMMARGFVVFANGGYLVDPYFLSRVENDRGTVLFKAEPKRVCRECEERKVAGDQPVRADADQLAQLLGLAPANTPAKAPVEGTAQPAKLAPRVLDERIAFLLRSVMHDVTVRGTAHATTVLKRNDLAGKTGTTNEHRDGWFTGFNDRIATTVWTGFDDFSSLGKGEFGAETALPTWIDFMRVALEGTPEQVPPPPPGITTAQIDPASGQLLEGSGGIVEYFKADDLPRLQAQRNATPGERGAEAQGTDIF